MRLKCFLFCYLFLWGSFFPHSQLITGQLNFSLCKTSLKLNFECASDILSKVELTTPLNLTVNRIVKFTVQLLCTLKRGNFVILMNNFSPPSPHPPKKKGKREKKKCYIMNITMFMVHLCCVFIRRNRLPQHFILQVSGL